MRSTGRPHAGSIAGAEPTKPSSTALAGSKSCQDCHEEFYHRWATSRHGLAMQPYTAVLARRELAAKPNEVVIGEHTYRAEVGEHQGWIKQDGPAGDKHYPIAYVMGGKNVYYFLTPFERGRLQVLPLAYDVHKKAWYDMAASGVRHFPDRRDEALDWTDRMFAFNTTCFNCHVTELSTNYDLATDTYRTTWSEPGISCELCHGAGKEHVRVMDQDKDVHKPKDLKIIRAGPHCRADKRPVRRLPCEARPAVARLSAGRDSSTTSISSLWSTPTIIPTAATWAKTTRYFVADESVRQGGKARLQPLSHAERTPAV